MATVLLVDDEPVLLDLMAEALEKVGHTVYLAPSREAALRISETPGRRIDVLLCDVLVGVHNGFEIAANITAIHPDARVILMSGSPKDRLSAGLAHQFLQKPFALADLLHIIAQLVEEAKTHDIPR